jgi:hypothetical protein
MDDSALNLTNNKIIYMRYLLPLLLVLMGFVSSAQQLHLKTGAFTPVENVGIPQNLQNWQIMQNKAYAIVQFYETPDLQYREQIESQTGIEFLYYVPDFAFVARVPVSFNTSQLTAFGVRSVVPYLSDYKIHPKLNERPFPAYVIQGATTIALNLFVHAGIDKNLSETLMAQNNITLINWKSESIAVVHIDEQAISAVADLPFVQFLSLPSAPTVLENLESRTNHRVNTLNNVVNGINFDGTGVSVAEGDDGIVGPHIDFKGRIFNHTSNDNGTHADHVGGIIAGAGNFEPVAAGNATGADLHVYSNYQNLSNAPTDYSALGVRITSNSLGQGCNNGYDSDAQDADMLILSKPSIMSVHSSGNSGGTSCGGVGGGYFTITGGYKAGKNVLAVGNLQKDDDLANSSSRGPSEDGRIKPDICAVGTNVYSTQPDNTYDSFTGTSMACPGVAGALASLWQAYRDLNGGNDPDSYLMKGILLNTADDLGNPGPDFQFGFGRINARRALDIISKNQFIVDSINTNGNRNYNIPVPPGVRQLKVMIYWNDKEGNPGNSVVLVNNLNMRVFDPSANLYNPWVLDNSANVAALSSPATRQKDNLNNVEQVTIDSAAAGNYVVNVKGFSVPFGPQKYVIVYDYITDTITLTYPMGGEHFANGDQERIRWDAFDQTGNFTLSYSTDAGGTWNNIATNIPGNQRYYDWTPPSNINSGQVLMQVSRNGFADTSDALFTVIGVPTGLVCDTACGDVFHLYWNPVTNADSYIVYMLGPKYMDSIATTSTNDIYLTSGVNMTDTFYFAVTAVNSLNGAKGRRSIAYMKLPGEINCLDDIYNAETILPFEIMYNCAVSSTLPVRVKIFNIGARNLYGIPIYYQVNANPIVSEIIPGPLNIGDSMIYTFNTLANFSSIGNYTVKTWSSIYSDVNKLNDTSMNNLTVILPVNLPAPVAETFEGPIFPPNGWKVLDYDTSVKWQKTFCLSGANGGNTHAAYIDHFNYGNIGAIDEMETAQLDLSNASADSVFLTFDVAYAYSLNEMDTLSVMLSTDCTQSYQQTSFKKWGAGLATAGAMTNVFSPTLPSQWRNERINLTAYQGQKLFVRFKGVNNQGNTVLVDNVNIQLKDAWPLGIPTDEVQYTAVYPNPSSGLYTLSMLAKESDMAQFTVMNLSGQVIQSFEHPVQYGQNNLSLDITDEAKGMYFLEINMSGKKQIIKLIKE